MSQKHEHFAHVPSFWDWSLGVYQEDGPLASALIEAQDILKLNVNVLLWCGWCCFYFGMPPELLMRKAADVTTNWSAHVTASIRNARRHINKESAAHADLREKLKSAELDAERAEQTLLEDITFTFFAPTEFSESTAQAPSDKDEGMSDLRRSISQYAALMNSQKKEGFTVSLLENIVERIAERHYAEMPS